MTHKLAIITTVYQNYDVLEDFLQSLKKQKNQDYHLYISDLSDNKKEINTKDLNATIISSENKGYAYGVNLGVKAAIKNEVSLFCILNNDTYFKPDFVDNVISSLIKHPNSILGGKIYYAPGYEYHKDRYKDQDKGKVIWYAGGEIDWNHAFTPHRGVDEVDHGQYDKSEKTGFITGALMCYDRTVHDKVGPWDESYFLYYEDSDFCLRAERSNVSLFYEPSVVMWHKVSQSTEGSGSQLHQRYQEKNRLRFGLKYAPLKTKLHLFKNFISLRLKNK